MFQIIKQITMKTFLEMMESQKLEIIVKKSRFLVEKINDDIR